MDNSSFFKIQFIVPSLATREDNCTLISVYTPTVFIRSSISLKFLTCHVGIMTSVDHSAS